jgi:hypothetical protein
MAGKQKEKAGAEKKKIHQSSTTWKKKKKKINPIEKTPKKFTYSDRAEKIVSRILWSFPANTIIYPCHQFR